MKRIICLILAVVMTALLAGCVSKQDKGGKSSSSASTAAKSAAKTSEQYATTDEVREKGTFKGQGSNDELALSMTLYGTTYTLGKSTVGDLVKNGWEKDEKNWEKIKPDQKIPAHSRNIIAKNMKRGGEDDADKDSIFISFRNITDKPSVPDKCALSKIEVNGRFDTSFGRSKLSCFDKKLDFTKCTDAPSFESELKKLVGTATREVKGYFYSTYYKYHFKVHGGFCDVAVRTDSSTGRLRNISVSIVLNEEAKG